MTDFFDRFSHPLDSEKPMRKIKHEEMEDIKEQDVDDKLQKDDDEK